MPQINLKLNKKRSYSKDKGKIDNYNNNIKTQTNNYKKIIKKDVVKDIIKEYYNDKKKSGCISYIPKKEVNTIFMRKFNQKYKDAIRTKKLKNV